MLNFGGKKFALCATKEIYSNSRVVRETNSERNKNQFPPPPLQVKWSVPNSHRTDYNLV